MKAFIAVLVFAACIFCAWSAIVPNKTQSKDGDDSPTIVSTLAWSLFNVSVVIGGIYYWGFRRNKTFWPVQHAAKEGEDVFDPNLWYIHGKAYDLAGFMSRHPGGYRPLMVSRGRDASELFESYHSLTDMPREMLKKFAVPSKDFKNYKSTFNWDMSSPANAFAVELRKEVRDIIKKQNIDTMAPTWLVFYCFGMLAITIWMTVKFYWAGEWWASVVVPTMWWLTFINTFHDASHFAFTRNEFHNSFWVHLFPYFTSPTTWDHQHVIGHHIYTNIFKKDPDLNHGMPIFRVHSRFSFRPWMQFQMFWVWLIWSVSTFFISFIYDWMGITTGAYHGVLAYQRLSPAKVIGHVLGRVGSIFVTVGVPFALFPFWQAMWWSVSFYAIWGFLFMLITQVNHIIEECLETAAEPNECWAIHQVNTAHDYCHNSFFWWFLSGGLNYQIEHHLFPGINSNHLPEIVPIVQNLCKKYSIPYNYSSSYTQAVGKYLKVVARGSENNNKKRD